MRLLILALLQLLVLMPLASFAANSIKTPDTQNIQKAKITKTYGKLPLYFMENKGQVDKAVKFYEKGAGHSTFFTEDGVVLTLTKSEVGEKEKTSPIDTPLKEVKDRKFTTEALRLSFVDANKKVKITSSSPLPGHVNYFIGNDKSKWRSNIPTYKAVTYKSVYKNIDIKFYGNNRDIEHDIIVRPGGDPSLVKFAYDGIKGLNITENGDLEVSLANGKIIVKHPIIYQEINGRREAVEGSYRIVRNENGLFSYGYTIASYDKTKELVIDPVLVYSTYLGGSKWDSVHGIAVDNAGAVYVTGHTGSTDFPLVSPIQGSNAGGLIEVHVTKINPAGTAIVYSTYLGGIGADWGEGIAVDSSGAVYVTGTTSSTDFPLVSPIQVNYGGGVDTSLGGDTFITKINPSGSAIIYSTYLGGAGDDIGRDIALDSVGAAYVTGQTFSTDFPLVNPFQPTLGFGGGTDTYVTKVNPVGSAFVYSTYLGGRDYDGGFGIAVDVSGAAYVTGTTYSTDFPLITPIQGTISGLYDAFVTKINPSGSALTYSTYLGGSSGDNGNGIALDGSGAAYVTGNTLSTDFPVLNPIQGTLGGISGLQLGDAFVTKINPTGAAIAYSTYLGGSDGDAGRGISVDNTGAAYVTGLTYSTDFPLNNPIQVSNSGAMDIFVTKINVTGTTLLYSTYLGGGSLEDAYDIATDNTGAAFVTGWTISPNFPLAHPLQVIRSGYDEDAFIAKIGTGVLPVLNLSIIPDVISVAEGSTLSYNVTATNTTAVTQCFQYWENISLTNGSTYPVTGELFGPIRLCLNAGASQTTHLTHGVPLTAPVDSYALNAFVGAYAFPVHPAVVSEAHFSFDVTVLNPATATPQTSWRPLENGFK